MAFNTVERTKTIGVQEMVRTTGTWTVSSSSGIMKAAKSAADETTTLSIPIHLDRRTDQTGVKIKRIVVNYRAITADLDAAPSCTLYRVALDTVAGASDDIDATSITITDDGVVTADANDRKLTVTVSDPAFDYDTEGRCYYQLDVAFNCAATTVLTHYSAEVVYDELT